MTRAEEVYADTLNLIGSDIVKDEGVIREVLDYEHALADPHFASIMAQRHGIQAFAAM